MRDYLLKNQRRWSYIGLYNSY